MNCKEFEYIVNDLARGRIIDASSRDDGLAHAQVCVQCARRLANERTICELLGNLAADDQEKSAPLAIESALVAAFRQQKTIERPDRIRQRFGRWALAAAAIIVFALGAYGLTVRFAIQSPPTKRESTLTERTSQPAPVPGEVPGALAGEFKKTVDEGQRRPPVRHPKKHHPKASVREKARPLTQPILLRDELTLYADDADVVTDFIPLTDGDSLKPIERGELIRVRMPRTALLRFGLPMNVERAGVPVKADLLVGDDGMARAIRFVR